MSSKGLLAIAKRVEALCLPKFSTSQTPRSSKILNTCLFELVFCDVSFGLKREFGSCLDNLNLIDQEGLLCNDRYPLSEAAK